MLTRITTIAAFATATILFGAASAATPANIDVTSIADIGLLAALNASGAQKVLGSSRLGNDVDRALVALKTSSTRPSQLRARGATAQATTLGIGRLGSGVADSAVYPAVYARKGEGAARHARRKNLAGTAGRAVARAFDSVSDRVSDCYGTPMHAGDNARGTDRYIVAVTFDASGKVQDVRTVVDSRYGDADMGACIAKSLRRVHFPAGVGPVEVSRSFSFRFTSTKISFE